MSATTYYDIKLRYMMDDRASKGAAALDRNLKQAASSSDMLGKALKMAAGYFGARAAWNGLVSFNSDLEQAKTTMSGMIMLTTGGKMEDAWKTAGDLVARFQQRAKVSVGTTADFVEMAQMITRPVLAAGLGMKDLEDFTSGAVVASKAFGIEAGMAARDIESALMGQLHSVDRFSRSLLEAKQFNGKYVGEEGRKAFNELTPTERAAEMRKALNSDAITEMAKKQEGTWAGVTSTLKDNIQLAIGKVGLPLFQKITAEVKSWNKWIDEHGPQLEMFGRKLGQFLVDAFETVKDTIRWIIDHKDTLLLIGKGFLAYKAISSLGVMGNLGGAFSNLGNVFGVAGKMSPMEGLKVLGEYAGNVATAGLKSFTTSLGGAAAGLGLLYMGANAVADAWLEIKDREVAGKTNSASVRDWSRLWRQGYNLSGNGGGQAGMPGFTKDSQSDLRAIYQAALSSGYLDKQGKLAHQKLVNDMVDAGAEEKEIVEVMTTLMYAQQRHELDVAYKMQSMAQLFATSVVQFQTGVLNNLLIAGATGGLKGAAMAIKPRVNVTINRIEVASDDPDRFAFGLVDSFRDMARNPSSAVSAFREG